jgi:Flp pilus assembly protein TadD
MNTFPTRSSCIAGILASLLTVAPTMICAQLEEKNSPAPVQGIVHDPHGQPLAGVAISLEKVDTAQVLSTTSDEHGKFRFNNVPNGSYSLHAKIAGFEDCAKGPFAVPSLEARSIVLLPTKAQDPVAGLVFSDEPAFTVSGVTDTTAVGGHGSGPVVRISNALSKEAASLIRESGGSPDAVSTPVFHAGPKEEAAVRAKLAKEDNAELHAELAEIEEAEGHALEAVREYQRAAEMQPSEPHFFAWGAELLLHHAPEPAIEVFSRGHRLYPQSSRMMLGLGAAWYAQRSKDLAAQTFLEACDLNPTDPIPYLFLGKLLITEPVLPAGWLERLKRFVELHQEDPSAHYLYAVALLKQGGALAQSNAAEAELDTALGLDPHFGQAYLQLGILRLGRENYSGAIAALQKAVENTPIPDDAHYRLAEAYRRAGETDKARHEIELYKHFTEQRDQEAERERHAIPQFVYTLRGQNPAPPPSH